MTTASEHGHLRNLEALRDRRSGMTEQEQGELAALRVLLRHGISWEPDATIPSAFAKLGNALDLAKRDLGAPSC